MTPVHLPEAKSSTRRRRESWFGLALTALACAGFLWWWFSRDDRESRAGSDPVAWLERAGSTLPQRHSIGIDYDFLFLARQWHAAGDLPAAARAAALISSPALREPAGIDLPPDETGPARPAAGDTPVASLVDQARAAYDQLDFAKGRELLDQAEATAAALADEPSRSARLAAIAATRYQLGAAESARATLERLKAARPNTIPEMPLELIRAFAVTDAIGPCLEWLSAQPGDSAGARAVARDLVRTMDDRIRHRESGDLTIHGGAADPGAPAGAERERREKIWAVVEVNDLAVVRKLIERMRNEPAESRARASLTVARALVWQRTRATAVEVPTAVGP